MGIFNRDEEKLNKAVKNRKIHVVKSLLEEKRNLILNKKTIMEIIQFIGLLLIIVLIWFNYF